ncbi:MAG TPA: DMT family transporter [Thermoanaerobaculia bacterium]|nr:DMT family transporter [Thermoanaerobaculia bacterium]
MYDGSAQEAGRSGAKPLPATGRALAPRLQLLAAAALFSTGGAAIKAVHFSGWPVACLRSIIAGAALLLLLPQVRRRPTARMLGVAACYAATMILFVLANKLTTAASTIYLQSTAPLFVLLLSPWLLGERVRRADLVSMAAIALGLVLLVTGLEPASATAPRPLRGNLLAALSGLTWALTIMGLRSLGRGGGAAVAPAAAAVDHRDTGAAGGERGAATDGDHGTAADGDRDAPAEGARGAPTAHGDDALVAAFWGNVLAAAAALPLSLPLPPSRATDWLVLAFLGLFQIALAYVLLSRGLGGVPALEASLLLLLEPVLNPLWAWLVHGERVGPRVLAGGAMILTATLLNSWHDARLAAREQRGRAAAAGA